MHRYIIRRILLFIPVLLGVSIIIFLLMRIVPGDVALMILIGPEGEGTVDQKQYQKLRTQLHLDRSVFCCSNGFEIREIKAADIPPGPKPAYVTEYEKSLADYRAGRITPGAYQDAYQGYQSSYRATPPSQDTTVSSRRGGVGSQYGEWIWGLIRGDWGKSIRTDTPVLKEIGRRFPLTFEMAALTVIVSVLIALPLGVLMAIRQDSVLDYTVRLLSIGGLAMPSFWTGALMLLFMTVWFNWIPPLGYKHFWDAPWDNIRQVIWATIALGYLLSAVIARMTRSTLLEVLRQDYIRTAWAKGLRERVVILRHALKNAVLPVVTLLGLYFAALIGGTVIMENLWNLPGLGRSLIESINFRDYPMVQGLIMLFAFMIMVTNLLVDLLYAWLDPRVHYT